MPFCGIADNVIFYSLIFCIISDNMVVKTGLPGKIYIVVPCIFRNPCFESPNDGCQVL